MTEIWRIPPPLGGGQLFTPQLPRCLLSWMDVSELEEGRGWEGGTELGRGSLGQGGTHVEWEWGRGLPGGRERGRLCE